MKSKIEIQEKLFQKKCSLNNDDYEGLLSQEVRDTLKIQIHTLEWVLNITSKKH